MQAADLIRQLKFVFEEGRDGTKDIDEKTKKGKQQVSQPGEAVAMKSLCHARFP
jgi:hypothetical protein